MPLISTTPAWLDLQRLRDAEASRTLKQVFAAETGRAVALAVDLGDVYLDYSRQRVSSAVLNGLYRLAEVAGVQDFLARMAAGETVNNSEGRAVLHTACRGTPASAADVASEIKSADEKLRTFVDAVQSGAEPTVGGGQFRAVVAIGIGGSELGPALALDALSDGCLRKLDVRVCGNIDGIAFKRAFAGLDPASTLVVVISKSFTTQETAANAERAKVWMRASLGDAWAGHFAVVSANLKATGSFGVDDARVFPMWDWVGGRYSLWSGVGLPVALAFGWDVFQAVRDGARAMDKHMLEAPLAENAPILLGLLSVWNASFLDYGAEATVPYDTRLGLLPDFLQQLEMESNGKRVTRDGEAVDYATQPVVLGGVGTNVQHAFFQQLHQGTTGAPVDILIPATPPSGDVDLHEMLVANALAQADALAFGHENIAEPHRHYPGNRPSSLLIYRDLTPSVLGKLLALYEHKTAAAGAVWGINSFDQWGVELGKTVFTGIRPMLAGTADVSPSLAPAISALARMRDRT